MKEQLRGPIMSRSPAVDPGSCPKRFQSRDMRPGHREARTSRAHLITVVDLKQGLDSFGWWNNFLPGGQGGGGVAERGSFGRAFVNVLCLIVVCLQRLAQGLEMLGTGFCLDRCHSHTIAVIVIVKVTVTISVTVTVTVTVRFWTIVITTTTLQQFFFPPQMLPGFLV